MTQFRTLLGAMLLLALSTAFTAESEAAAGDILIENVYLATSEETRGPLNVAIRDSKLDLITEDAVTERRGSPSSTRAAAT